jgi:hypothetical protein
MRLRVAAVMILGIYYEYSSYADYAVAGCF